MDKEEYDLDSDIPTISFIRIGQSLSPNEEINGEELNIKKKKRKRKRKKEKSVK